MAGNKTKPIALHNNHMSKAQKEERAKREVKACTDEILCPEYLTTQKHIADFEKYSRQLQKIKIMAETDVDALARFILSNELYISLTKKLCSKSVLNDIELVEKYMKQQDKAFKQCHTAASALGLTISSRCKLQLPPEATKEEPVNKFDKFKVG